MLLESCCLCLSFSLDSVYLASGSQDGSLVVWDIHSGKIVRKFKSTHTQGITSVSFSADGTQVLTTSFDFTIRFIQLTRLNGMNSGKMLKVYRGHTSFVNAATFTYDNSKVISGSSDGTVKIWNASTTDCISTLHLQDGQLLPKGINLPAVHSVIKVPGKRDLYLISNHSRIAYLIDDTGKVFSFNW